MGQTMAIAIEAEVDAATIAALLVAANSHIPSTIFYNH